MLSGKKFIIGVTGGIAAYKTALIIRLLVKQGAEVRVIMTEGAKKFITPLTLATLSKNSILVDFFDPSNGSWNSHISLGLWADAFLIAPATANTLAKMSCGIADNLLLTTYLSARCPIFVALAMDVDMYEHSTTQSNIQHLVSSGVNIIYPEEGELASGLEGKGRMAEPEKIVEILTAYYATKQDMVGKRFLVTAGATIERIDPVRYISNFSTGKMGYAIAMELAERGAKVSLVSGKTALQIKHSNIEKIEVESAVEMYEQSVSIFPSMDGAILVAAVADYRPQNVSLQKIKKEKTLEISLVSNPDIAATLGEKKSAHQVLVGFALESNNEIANAQDKLRRKHFDFIVMNSLQIPNACFNSDSNKITIIDKLGHITEYPYKSKTEVAKDIVTLLSGFQKIETV